MRGAAGAAEVLDGFCNPSVFPLWLVLAIEYGLPKEKLAAVYDDGGLAFNDGVLPIPITPERLGGELGVAPSPVGWFNKGVWKPAARACGDFATNARNFSSCSADIAALISDARCKL